MIPLSEPAGEPLDSGDCAAQEAETTRTIALHRHLARVEVLEDQVIDDDGHVHCLDCPTLIPPERLAAQRHAVRCADCQEAHELQQLQATGRRR